MAKYSISGFKSFIGREGHGFNANLLRDGVKVAFVIDSANGGTYQFDWTDRAVPKVDVTVRNYKNEVVSYKGTPNEAAFAAFVSALPKLPADDLFPEGRFADMDAYMARLVDTEETLKGLRTKRKLIFHADGQVFTCKLRAGADDVDTVFKRMKEKYPSAVKLNYASAETLESLGILKG